MRRLGLLPSISLAALVSISPLAVGATASEEPQALHFELERGPVKVTVEVVPAPARLSDLPKLTLRVECDPDVAVKLPSPAGEMGGFSVRSLAEPPSITRDTDKGRRRIDVLEVELEPLETGKLTLPAFDIACVDHRRDPADPASTAETAAAGKPFTVSTEPIEIDVRSLVEGEAPSLDALAPPLPPLGVEIESRLPIGWIAGAVALLSIAAIVFLLARGRGRKAIASAPPPTAEELARREFQALVATRAVARGELASFFSELTLIVRRYIERTKGVRAPEQTTEEFLREMRRHAAFDAESRERLQSFLEAADLVKFAGMRPTLADVEESFRRGQEFAGQRAPLTLEAVPRETSS